MLQFIAMPKPFFKVDKIEERRTKKIKERRERVNIYFLLFFILLKVSVYLDYVSRDVGVHRHDDIDEERETYQCSIFLHIQSYILDKISWAASSFHVLSIGTLSS